MITVNAAWNVWNFRTPIVHALQRDGHDVTVLAPPDDSVQSLQSKGCRYIPLEMSVTGMNPLQDIALMRRMRAIFRNEQPDVILSYTIKNNIFGAIAARSEGIPFIPNVTGLGTAFLSGGILQGIAQALYRYAFAQLPVVFFQNEDDRHLFTSRGLVREAQARVLPGSGIDLARFSSADYPLSDTAPTFLMIARLLRDKGVVEFAEAARVVKREHPHARFQLMGALAAENRSAISKSDLDGWLQEGIIEYLGVSDDVRPHIASSHCVVLPSYREGAPRTLIEAASMSRPVITTDVPGCRSVLDPGASGLLCAPRDAESLSSTIRRFIAMPHHHRAAMGRTGRRHMELHFDEAIVVNSYSDAIMPRSVGRAQHTNAAVRIMGRAA